MNRTAKGQIYEAFGIRDGEEIQQPAHHPNSLLDKEKKSDLLLPVLPSLAQKIETSSGRDSGSGPFHLLLYKKEDFDRCLPYILPLRKFAKKLQVNFYWSIGGFDRRRNDYYRLIDYQATNDFLEKIKSTRFDSEFALPDIYLNSGFLRKMDTGHSGDLDYRDPLEKIFLNRIGYYIKPTDDAVKRTFNEFFYGATNLEYQLPHHSKGGGFPLLEYLFSRFAPEDEYYLEDWGYYWTMTIATKETGRRHHIERGLQFINEEIHNFGGNNSQVTLMGHSTGGCLVYDLAYSLTVDPKGKLFQQMIIMSGPLFYSTQEKRLKNSGRVLMEAGCLLASEESSFAREKPKKTATSSMD